MESVRNVRDAMEYIMAPPEGKSPILSKVSDRIVNTIAMSVTHRTG